MKLSDWKHEKVTHDLFLVFGYRPPYAALSDKPAVVSVWSVAADAFLRDLSRGGASFVPGRVARNDLAWDIFYGPASDFGTVDKARRMCALAPEPRKPYETFTVDLP